MNNTYLVDKPVDWTSFDVVAKIRNGIRHKPGYSNNFRPKVGHAGTLDPFASGLMIVLVGDATKKQNSFMKLDKEYEAKMRLGWKSSTFDSEGEITEISDQASSFSIPDRTKVEEMMKNFLGEIEQVPPVFSAIKINGERAYKKARRGEDFKIPARFVRINSIEVMSYEYPYLEFRVSCSSGTYIRSLAIDIAEALGTVGYLTDLRRTKVGQFDISQAQNIDNLLASLQADID
jgi:tRNA pseudouridine55 synthase